MRLQFRNRARQTLASRSRRRWLAGSALATLVVLVAAGTGAATRATDERAQAPAASERLTPLPGPTRTQAGGLVLNEVPLQLMSLQLLTNLNDLRHGRTAPPQPQAVAAGRGGRRFFGGGDCTSPTNTVAPLVSAPNPAYVGNVITTGNGSWSCPPTAYHYQWLRNGVAISGATSSSYTIQSGNSDVGATIRSSVQACNGIDCSSYVQSSNYAVPANRAPNAPTNLSPADPFVSSGLTPTLSGTFTDPDGQTGYISFTVQRASTGATVATGSSPWVWSGTATSWTVPGGSLHVGVQYSWYAQAGDASGASSGSVGPRFYTVPPVAPTLVTPIGGASVATLSPVLSASPGSGNSGSDPLSYEFQVGSDAAFSTVLADSGWMTTTTTWAVPAGVLRDGTTYYWRARACGFACPDDAGAWTTGKASK